MMQRSKAATPLLVLLGLLLAHGPLLPEARYEADDVELTFDLEEQPIDALLRLLRPILVDNKPRLTFGGLPVLAPKDALPGSPPCRWLKVTLVAGDDRTTLAFGDSDIYLLAFTNVTRHWNCFPGYDTLFPNGRNLSFSENYKSLADGHEKLVNVPLGKAAAIRAVRILSRYNPYTTPEEDGKLATVTFMIMISEALRFKDIRHLVSEEWEGECHLNKDMAELVVHWGQASYCLYLWEQNGVWPGRKRSQGLREVGITSAATAIGKLDLLKRPQIISINSSVY